MNKFLKLDLLVFFIILLFSLLFRVTNLDLIEFKTDEAVNLLLASKLTPGGTVSSVGVLNPPLFNYILSPFTFFTLDPRFFSFLIGLINSFSIALFYLIVKKYYGNIIALTSSLLFAFSPWAIIYSRKIWIQDLLVPFVVLMFYSYHKIMNDKDNRFWTLLVLSSLFLIQLHEISIIFIILFFFFMFLFKRKLHFKYAFIGIIIGIIPFLPYLNYEIKNNYSDFKALITTKNKLSTQFSVSHFLRPVQIVGLGNFSFILGPDMDTFSKKYPLANKLRRAFYIEYILIIFGALLFFKNRKQLRFIFYSCFLLPFVYFFLKVEPFMHYYIIILPFLFIFLGTAFEFLLTKKGWIRTFSFILFIFLIANSLLFNLTFFDLLKNQGYLRGDYGDSFKESLSHVKHQAFDELFLFQFVPLTYAFGYNPFAKMILNDTASIDIPQIEEKFEKSNDPRLKQRLLAFYTKDLPTLENLDILRKKAKNNSIYSDIYKVVLEDYLSRNYKKEYVSEKFDLRLFYPSHWKITENSQMEIEGDSIILTIRKNDSPPYITQVIEKSENKEALINEKRAAGDIIKSIRFLSE